MTSPANAAAQAVKDELICARCARERKTCCQTSEVHATLADVRRIVAHSGRTDFTEFRAPIDRVYLDNEDDPAWMEHVFRPDGTRRVLKRRANGDCTFLGDAGCELPLDVRPIVCRMYPYEYDESGLTDVSTGCPLHLLPKGRTILEELDMDRRVALAWHAQLYAEIREREQQ